MSDAEIEREGMLSDMQTLRAEKQELHDEIERLTAALATCRELREYECAEIERLRIMAADYRVLLHRTNAAEDEVKRLRAERDLYVRDCASMHGKDNAEIERLRATLELYSCPDQCPEPRMKDGTCLRANTGGLCGEDARRALEPKR